MRRRPASGGSGGRISSQNGDGSFLQRSFAHTSFSDIGLVIKRFNDTLGELQQLGVQHVAELPELVMVGDQSAGKSSLMSGLAELDLPRSGGVCTRCPIHIRLSSSRNNDPNGWSCTVSLQQEYDYKPPESGRIKKSDVTKQHPFAPWIQKSHRIASVFKTIYDKADIEEVLRWAQVAILNPSRSFELFVPEEGAYAKETSLADAVQETEAQFSPNIVALEIKGPSLPDLSFYDLPGVFLSPPREEDEYIVQVVRNLTSHYVRRQQAIIMWAVPMNQDPENSISLGIIREAKALARTIGVMTKADKVQADNTAQWVSMLRGEKHPVGQGFFITSRPHDAQVGLGSVAQWEDKFFNEGIHNWPPVFQEFTDRCGVELLKDFLSKKLGDAFSSSLPSIKHKIHERLRTIHHQLSELPELPNNVEHEVKTSLYTFYNTVRDAIKDRRFQAKWDVLNKQFQSCITKMKPTCIVKDSEPTPLIELAASDEESTASALVAADTPSRKRPRASDSTIRPTPKRPRPESHVLTPVKNEEATSFSRPSPSASFCGTPIPEAPSGPPSPFEQFHQLGRQGLNIRNIRTEILNSKRAGMPHDIVQDEVYDRLVISAIEKWREPLDRYMNLTMELFQGLISNALIDALGALSNRMIFIQARNHLDAFIQQMEVRQRSKVIDLFDAEKYQMYTTNVEAYNRYRDAEEHVLRRVRDISRIKSLGHAWDYHPPPVEKMTEELWAEERKKLREPLAKLKEDPYATEIKVAAVVRGYYMTAAMRFVESVTLSVNSRLFRDLAAGPSLEMFLNDKLGLMNSNPAMYEHLMEEDDAIATKRDQFKCEMEKLKKAMQRINELENSSGSGAVPGFGSEATRDGDGYVFVDDEI
ncbi:P-loop containing nucleoside triphosphate hydrolase protein [Pseudomassariella vexata]|uniref:p-loop containing nucleoside triphosphate hydrolase protein n=1 Tax=Pseudomassariella vexata TaxID=1141098 RepID=A0A1Y2DR98_9PEZI|nr:P-loop containing nucleoside triphosphate hydrolase protein [Pseudomassariella vexata]ORY61803.1 P-loop containing nucleoside triphosphate hydrolase protein [Pseudomassariella vexata]